MKWKSDTIEQFVKYKIEHPQESYQILKNYQLEKKQNQHLDKMHKQLQQLRKSRDYFMNELHKLNKIAQTQGQRNLQDMKQIDQKCEIMAQKLNDTKVKRNTQIKKTKSQIISQYEEQINEIQNAFQTELNQHEQSINKVKNQLQKLHVQKTTQQLLQKIATTKQKIEQKKIQYGQRAIKIKQIKNLQQQLSQKLKSINQKKAQLKNKKQQQQQIKKRQLQMEQQLYQQMKHRTQIVHNNLLREIRSKILSQSLTISSLNDLSYQSPVKNQEFSKQRPYSMEERSTVDNQITQQMLFNPHIDFSYSKKNKNISSTKKTQQKIQQPHQNTQFLHNNIDLFRKFIKKIQMEHEIDLKTPLKNQQEAKNYLLSKYNHSSQDLHTQLDLMIQVLEGKIQAYRVQSDKFISQQNDQITAQQNVLAKKQKQLDKQIQHLQNKVQKTQLEISKKNKV